jgi:hypothetical protein
MLVEKCGAQAGRTRDGAAAPRRAGTLARTQELASDEGGGHPWTAQWASTCSMLFVPAGAAEHHPFIASAAQYSRSTQRGTKHVGTMSGSQ